MRLDRGASAHAFGRARSLGADSSPRTRSLLRFRVTGVRTVRRAVLEVYVRAGNGRRLEARRLSGRAWSEGTVTGRRTPALLGGTIARGAPAGGRWVGLDVTALLHGPQTVELGLTTGGGLIRLAAREDRAHAPRLYVRSFADAQPAAPVRAADYVADYPEALASRYHPVSGAYRSTDPALLAAHRAELAHGGVRAALVAWDGIGSVADLRLPTLLSTTARAHSRLRWAVLSRRDATGNPGSAELAADLTAIDTRFGRQSAYLRRGSRPVVFAVLSPGDRCGAARRWIAANAGPRVHLVLTPFPGYRSCPSQPSAWAPVSPAAGASRASSGDGYAIAPGGFPRTAAAPVLTRDLERWRGDVARMVASRKRWQVVSSFNDWNAGTSVEPATEWLSPSLAGQYLDILDADGREPSGRRSADPVIAAAGDPACSPMLPTFNAGAGNYDPAAGPLECHTKATGDLLAAPDVSSVLAVGDIAENLELATAATLADYQGGYDPGWGRLREKIHPVPGNHEYNKDRSYGGYWDYWNGVGQNTGRGGMRGEGWYSFDQAGWHIVGLNSQLCIWNGCGPGTPQYEFLKADLAAHPTACTLAFWHHPLYSTGYGSSSFGNVPWPSTRPLWTLLGQYGAELVLSGHDHDYERFVPQDGAGHADPSGGIRQFVVGTGGRSLLPFNRPLTAATEVRDNTTFGVLRLQLHPDGYRWRFQPEAARPTGTGTFSDAGAASCH